MSIVAEANGWVVCNSDYDVVDYINSMNLQEEHNLNGPVMVSMSKIEHCEDTPNKQFFTIEFVGDGMQAALVFDKIVISLKNYLGRLTPMEIETRIKFIE